MKKEGSNLVRSKGITVPTQPQTSFAIQALVNKHKTHKLVSFSENFPKSGGEGVRIVVKVGKKENKAKRVTKQIEQKLLMWIPLPTSTLFGFNHA